MKAFLRRKRSSFIAYIVMVACGGLTTYMFAASYETVFNTSLPFVHAVSTVGISPIRHVVDTYHAVSQTDIGNYGKPLLLKLPAQDIRMILAPGIQDGDHFLARASAGHYFITSVPKTGNLGDAVIYYEKSWRTNNNPEKMKTGDNIFIDTDRDWRYFYRVDAISTVTHTQTFVSRAASSSQLVLAAVDGDRLVIAQASLINVQNVRQ